MYRFPLPVPSRDPVLLLVAPTPHKATHKSSAERELVGYQLELVRISIAEKKKIRILRRG